MSEQKKSSGLSLGRIILILIIISAISSVFDKNGSSSSKKHIKYHSYSSAVNTFEKAFNKPDGDLYAKVTLPTDQYKNMSEDSIKNMTEFLNILHEATQTVDDSKLKIRLKIEDKEKLSDAELSSLKNFYSSNYSGECPEIEEGYNLTAELKIDDEKETVHFDVICFEDDGWRVSEQAVNTIFSGGGLYY